MWWLAFWTVFGLCIGSFLNVIIYRLPRNQSLYNPRWSHCPACGHRIRWYDNLPVLSFALLSGRCRDCRSVISLRYPIVEMLTALVVLVIFDAFFVARVREGLLNQPGLTWGVAQDWPVFLAHLVLFACLLAMAAIDLKEYWVDIRFT
ncbi:MAG: prepilin peptidase, partial [bacterium]|nr:prepilin peptidase [bacterium]